MTNANFAGRMFQHTCRTLGLAPLVPAIVCATQAGRESHKAAEMAAQYERYQFIGYLRNLPWFADYFVWMAYEDRRTELDDLRGHDL